MVWDKAGNGCSTGSYAPGIPLRQRAPGLTEYQALAKLQAQGVRGTELDSAAAHLRRALAIMRAGGPIESYLAAVAPLRRYPVLREFGITEATPENYSFWQNLVDFQYRPDTALRELHQPVLAIFGDRDEAVDWRESIQVYREAFRRGGNRDVTIKVFKGADHELMRLGSKTQPVAGYLEAMKKWLTKYSASSELQPGA